MDKPIDCWSLTEKEKQTLRLIVRGHDAKSAARSLGLSVHTVNERLRDARRKMSVSSSREAARVLLAAEGDAGPVTPELSADTRIGGDAADAAATGADAPMIGVERTFRSGKFAGACLMMIALGLFALAALPDAATAPAVAPVAVTAPVNAELVEVARAWLGLLDQSWDESYRATAPHFQKLNTVQVWAAASEQARVPLGAVISRVFLSQENLPAPPAGYEVVKFRTSFVNKPGAVETVSFDRIDGHWRVAGVTIG